MASAVHRTIEALWRIESASIIATVARMTGDVGIAEDLVQEAFVTAIERWSQSGLPEKPGAWLMTAAKHRAIDLIRRNKLLDEKHQELGQRLLDEQQFAVADFSDTFASQMDAPIEDDLLRLIFIACHPVLSTEAQTALTLRLLGGLSTQEIAHAFLVPEATIAQRIVRAKRTLAAANVPFELPHTSQLAPRLSAVLRVLYLIFNEGYAATSGEDWIRPSLCEEALRLGRILAELLPGESEVHGLVALMELQASRMRARVGPTGQPILLMEQDRARWDHLLVQRGLARLERAASLGNAFGPYSIQAAIAACHARARLPEETDWQQIAALYDALAQILPSPVVELNRAVAVAMAFGPAAGLEIVDDLMQERSLANYHLLPSVRGDLLAKLGRLPEARIEFERAATMTQNQREQQLLLARAAECGKREETEG
ncbi:MAG: RNA polymerase sigma factor [Chlorobi bacterium]|nr:RNA polymerase sigma factor [Chlorobiota bacterium]MBX7217237.1 RNA polymerase sigma factor [Candidatus Kapabacteria bacterium]